MDEAAVFSVGHQRRRAGKLRSQIRRQLRRRELIGGRVQVFHPRVGAQVQAALLLALFVELALQVLIH